jgi:hypothetical protein
MIAGLVAALGDGNWAPVAAPLAQRLVVSEASLPPSDREALLNALLAHRAQNKPAAGVAARDRFVAGLRKDATWEAVLDLLYTMASGQTAGLAEQVASVIGRAVAGATDVSSSRLSLVRYVLQKRPLMQERAIQDAVFATMEAVRTAITAGSGTLRDVDNAGRPMELAALLDTFLVLAKLWNHPRHQGEMYGD